MSKIVIVIIIIAGLGLGGYFFFMGKFRPASLPPETSNQRPEQPRQTSEPEQPVSQTPEQTPIAEEKIVIYGDSGYSPPTLSVKKGETVTFKNQSSRSMWPASAMHPSHRVYSGTSLGEHCPDTGGNAFDACKGFLPGEAWSFKFSKTGVWKYHDHLSPGNFGAIAVE